jgi:hypothetical protein
MNRLIKQTEHKAREIHHDDGACDYIHEWVEGGVGCQIIERFVFLITEF